MEKTVQRKRDFSQFKIQMADIYKRLAPIDGRMSYYRWNNSNANPVSQRDFTLEEIEEIIRSGDLESLRELSRYYYRTNSEYHNNIDFLAHLPLFSIPFLALIAILLFVMSYISIYYK